MEILKLVYIQWLSCERDKYVWEDLYNSSWDEIMGRIYLLKAHDEIEHTQYAAALADFEQALLLLAKDTIRNHYVIHALADKATVQCILGQYQAALATFNQAVSLTPQPDEWLLQMLVLAGTFTDALKVLEERLAQSPHDEYQRFTLAICLLHLERYQEAITNYEQALAGNRQLDNVGLRAALQQRQPDWNKL
jgi:tetratricopeptide (TPR) repeat protein